jgi:UDP-glucose 4-epimerase
MRILVTGGAGFIGSHLVDKLLLEKHEIVVLDNLSTGRKENIHHQLHNNKLTFVKGDIRNFDLLKSLVKGQDCVVHLAAITSIPFSFSNPLETLDVNVTGTANLLQASVDGGVQKMIFASSCAVYGEADHLPINEEDPLKPMSPYAASKISASELCRDFQKKYGLRTICLRLFNVYGPRQNQSGDGGVISHFTRKLVLNETPIIYGDGDQTRDFIYVKDVVCAIERTIETNSGNGSVNLGSGIATTINHLLETIYKVAGTKPKGPVHKLPRPGDIRHSQADIRKLLTQLNFKPLTILEGGLQQVLHGETA